MKYACKNRQRGVAMIISLVALAAISLAAVALMRSVDTGNVVSGNLAFNEAAIQMADVGAEDAYTFINSNTEDIATSCQTVTTGVCPSYYYPNIGSLDAVTRLPVQAAALTWSEATDVPGQTGFTYQYVIERMCKNTTPDRPTSASPEEQATFAKCTVAILYDDTTGLVVQEGLGKLFYRITVQVNGPRNTRALAQYFYGIQDTVN